MHLSWPEHLQTARLIGSSADDQRGMSLALMGIALLLLAQDLLAQEQEGLLASGGERPGGAG